MNYESFNIKLATAGVLYPGYGGRFSLGCLVHLAETVTKKVFLTVHPGLVFLRDVVGESSEFTIEGQSLWCTLLVQSKVQPLIVGQDRPVSLFGEVLERDGTEFHRIRLQSLYLRNPSTKEHQLFAV